ncbi:MAG: ribosome biogenesis GTPase Der [Anaerolineae bacterium]
MARKPLVALVGRPNVGKSTLFNKLVGERMAVTDDVPGTTRDRLQSEFEWRGIFFNVVDTGGIEVYQPRGEQRVISEGSAEFVPQIKAQAMMAVEAADVVILVVDAVAGITAADEEIAVILQRSQKPVLVAANKVDHISKTDDAVEFFSLGLGEVYPTSAIHGAGVGDLLDAVYQSLPEELRQIDTETQDDELKIAIVGRPNVGKSSLVNRLLGEDRVIVSPIAGTTRDAIDSTIMFYGESVTLIDTAGIRRRGRIEPGIEKYSVLRSMNAIERCDVALLLIDAADGITDQDMHIAGYVMEAGKSIVLLINKWDAVPDKTSTTLTDFQKLVRAKFDFLPDPPVLFISALTGQRIHEVLETAKRVWENRHFRIPTADLNRIVRDAMQTHTPPVRGTRRLKIMYAAQVNTNPPFILLHVNDVRLVHFTYKRFLENQIRQAYPFEGTPLRMSFRNRDSDV